MRVLRVLPILVMLCSLIVTACGVKGKPMPPLTAPPIGRGQPTMAQPEEEEVPSTQPPGRPRKKTAGESR